jgi:hypothetical protein
LLLILQLLFLLLVLLFLHKYISCLHTLPKCEQFYFLLWINFVEIKSSITLKLSNMGWKNDPMYMCHPDPDGKVEKKILECLICYC